MSVPFYILFYIPLFNKMRYIVMEDLFTVLYFYIVKETVDRLENPGNISVYCR